jgi:hypothetical protein
MKPNKPVLLLTKEPFDPVNFANDGEPRVEDRAFRGSSMEQKMNIWYVRSFSISEALICPRQTCNGW